ncbi:mitochondrial ribosomal small subunit component [Tulasnella sp. 427]|nr:mitochondrial ribosomal small subunit component [Tulasnella sp. 427]
MPRRFASQVHVTVSRLLRSRFIEQPPAWFDAVMQYPPIPTPARAPPKRSLFDAKERTSQQKKSAAKHGTWHRPEAQDITYLEDRVRRQFFKDHPFEAFRARTLVESGVELEENQGVSGKNWTRLEQRTQNPSPEDAVRFAINLHEKHDQPLAIAYKAAATQFRALRSEHQIASAFAAQEAESYGAEFGPRELEVGFAQERESIKSFLPTVQAAARHSNKLPWAAVWSMPGVQPPPEQWTRGEEYMQKVENGVRPVYSPDLPGGSSFEAFASVEGGANVSAQAVVEPAVQRA